MNMKRNNKKNKVTLFIYKKRALSTLSFLGMKEKQRGARRLGGFFHTESVALRRFAHVFTQKGRGRNSVHESVVNEGRKEPQRTVERTE